MSRIECPKDTMKLNSKNIVVGNENSQSVNINSPSTVVSNEGGTINFDKSGVNVNFTNLENKHTEALISSFDSSEINGTIGSSTISDNILKASVPSSYAVLSLVSDVYTKTETDKAISDAINSIPGVNPSNYYTKTQTDNLLDTKANSNDVYTKTQTDNLLDTKANSNDVYTKTQTDNLLDTKANSNDVYTKTETDNTFLTQSNASSTYQPKLTNSYIKVLTHMQIGHLDSNTSTNLVAKETPTKLCDILLRDDSFTAPLSGDVFEIWIRGTIAVSSDTASNPETFVGKGDGAAGMTSLIFRIKGISIPLNWAVRTSIAGTITIDVNTTAKVLASDIIPGGGESYRYYGEIFYYSANYTKYKLTFTQQYDIYATHYRIVSF